MRISWLSKWLSGVRTPIAVAPVGIDSRLLCLREAAEAGTLKIQGYAHQAKTFWNRQESFTLHLASPNFAASIVISGGRVFLGDGNPLSVAQEQLVASIVERARAHSTPLARAMGDSCLSLLGREPERPVNAIDLSDQAAQVREFFRRKFPDWGTDVLGAVSAKALRAAVLAATTRDGTVTDPESFVRDFLPRWVDSLDVFAAPK
ncbi:MAG: hypothetical protein ACKVPX_14030 [Myxococcaceae bacterium]